MSKDKTVLQSLRMLQPGLLWQHIQAKTTHALKYGALQPLLSSEPIEVVIGQAGICFRIWVVPQLARRVAAKPQASSGSGFSPFLPYEEELFVTHISDTHLCLLNKFSLVDYQTLIVTRSFVEQESLLTLTDFEAMGLCLAEGDGLMFYNSGQASGGSQRHRHLQLLPLPLAAKHQLPIEAAIAQAQFGADGIGRIPAFPFVHAIVPMAPGWATAPIAAAPITLSCYYRLLNAVGLLHPSSEHLKAYNLLATREWMLLIPRSQANFASVSINALAFAGVFLVQDETQLQHVREFSPMKMLNSVSLH